MMTTMTTMTLAAGVTASWTSATMTTVTSTTHLQQWRGRRWTYQRQHQALQASAGRVVARQLGRQRLKQANETTTTTTTAAAVVVQPKACLLTPQATPAW